MTILSSTEDFHKVYGKYEHCFVKNQSPGFHNLIWKFVVNDVHRDKMVVFHPVPSKYNKAIWSVGLVEHNEDGFYHMQVDFTDGYDYDSSYNILEEINEMMFGLTPKEQDVIVTSSMTNMIANL